MANNVFANAPETGKMFTMAALAFAAGSQRGIGTVLDAIAEDEDSALTRAAVSALGWLEPSQLNGRVQPLLDDGRVPVRALGLGACAIHRVDPGAQLAGFLDDQVTSVRAAITVAGPLGRTDLSPRIAAKIRNDSAETRFAAARASVLLGDRDAPVKALRDITEAAGLRSRAAFELAVLASSRDEVHSWIGGLGKEAEPLAIRASGLMGQPDHIAWLIERMRVPELAQIAEESFSMVTGADLSFLDLDGPPLPPEAPNDDPSDDRVELDADAELPTPDPEAVCAWWIAESARNTAGQDYFLGRPITDDTMQYGLDRGYQRQRRISALRLGLSSPKAVLSVWQQRDRHVLDWKAVAAR